MLLAMVPPIRCHGQARFGVTSTLPGRFLCS